MKGLILEGRYELVKLIATGGMGQVWKGQDLELEREVAVKILREEYAGEEGYLKRFRAEARHTAALAHEAIAGLYDYGELDGRAYIVMELVPGRPLSDIIEENPAGISEEKAIALIKSLAQALDAAHVKGVVHRDVKPENVLIDEDNEWALKITDFGIARSHDQAKLTKTGLVMGTAQYLSPEQAMGRQATSLSDVYALGIVAYEILTGARPFTGASQVEIAMAQVKETPPKLPENINPALSKLVMMMLAKAPANRPRSAAAVARILGQIQHGEAPDFETTLNTHRATQTTGHPISYSANSASSASEAPGLSRRKKRSSSSRTQNPISPTGTKTAALPLAKACAPVTIRSSQSANHSSSNSANDKSLLKSPNAKAFGSEAKKSKLGWIILLSLIVIAVITVIVLTTNVFNTNAQGIFNSTTLLSANFIEWEELAKLAKDVKGTV